MADLLHKDVYLPPGTRVRHDGLVLGSDGDPEFGVVIHCWRNEDEDIFDCSVAFFGDSFPDAAPQEPPYVLRYASMSLIVLDEVEATP